MLLRQTGPMIDVAHIHDVWHEATDRGDSDSVDFSDFTIFGGCLTFHADHTVAFVYGQAAITAFMNEIGRGWDIEVKFDRVIPIKRLPPRTGTSET